MKERVSINRHQRQTELYAIVRMEDVGLKNVSNVLERIDRNRCTYRPSSTTLFRRPLCSQTLALRHLLWTSSHYPEQVEECSRKNLVFGFPITNEWFLEPYEVMKKSDVKEASEEFLSTASALADLCQSMYPDWGHISLVVVACGDYGSCTLIRVGAAGWKPPKSVIVDMAKELRKYGLVEKPNWFPGIGLKSTHHKSVGGCG